MLSILALGIGILQIYGYNFISLRMSVGVSSGRTAGLSKKKSLFLQNQVGRRHIQLILDGELCGNTLE